MIIDKYSVNIKAYQLFGVKSSIMGLFCLEIIAVRSDQQPFELWTDQPPRLNLRAMSL